MWKPQYFSTPKQQKKKKNLLLYFLSSYQNIQHFSLLMFLPFFFNSQGSKTAYTNLKKSLEFFSLESEILHDYFL